LSSPAARRSASSSANAAAVRVAGRMTSTS
jgi:hypothetical protein